MALVSDVLDQLVAIVSGVTPDTVYFETRAFRHIEAAYDAEAGRTQDATRRFVLLPTGDRQWTGWMGAAGAQLEVEAEFGLDILYRQGQSAHQFFKVVAEDVDRLTWELQRNTNYSAATSGISKIEASGYSIDLGGEAQNAMAIVSIGVTVTYLPTFTG